MQMSSCKTQKVMRKALLHIRLPLLNLWMLSIGGRCSSNEDLAAGWYAVSVFKFMIREGAGVQYVIVV